MTQEGVLTNYELCSFFYLTPLPTNGDVVQLALIIAPNVLSPIPLNDTVTLTNILRYTCPNNCSHYLQGSVSNGFIRKNINSCIIFFFLIMKEATPQFPDDSYARIFSNLFALVLKDVNEKEILANICEG